MKYLPTEAYTAKPASASDYSSLNIRSIIKCHQMATSPRVNALALTDSRMVERLQSWIVLLGTHAASSRLFAGTA